MLFWNASQRGEASPTHKIVEFDEKTHMGVCAICGPVAIYTAMDKQADGRPRLRLRCSRQILASPARVSGRYRRGRKRHAGRYGMSVEEFDALVLVQQGCCALCGAELRKLNVDHCHDSERVRGLLCTTCNTGLGKFGDDPTVLRRAAAYLEAHT